MLTKLRHPPRLRLISGLLLLAFVMRALVPVGFMPGQAPFTVELCTSAGFETVVIDPSAHDGAGSSGAVADHAGLCAFSATPALAPPPALLAFVATPLEHAAHAASYATVESSRASGAHFARGPPAHS